MKNKSLKLGMGMKKAVANSTCVYISHQPKLPETAKKLRKF